MDLPSGFEVQGENGSANLLGASEAFHIDQDDTMSDGGWIDWSGL